jgi:hypothetical protein
MFYKKKDKFVLFVFILINLLHFFKLVDLHVFS